MAFICSQMVMNSDNPRNNGLLLEVLLGIVSQNKSSLNEEAAVLESSILIAGFIDQSPGKPKCSK